MKLTIVGAGSSYTPEIIDGLLGQACFGTLEVALYDLPEGMKRTQIVCDMALRMAGAPEQAGGSPRAFVPKGLVGSGFCMNSARRSG